MRLLQVSALGGGRGRSGITMGSFAYAVTVDRIRFTDSSSWSCWHSISNSRLPTFIFRRIGGFVVSVILFPYCLLYCARCACTTFKYFTN
jgi:hypothetical protein